MCKGICNRFIIEIAGYTPCSFRVRLSLAFSTLTASRFWNARIVNEVFRNKSQTYSLLLMSFHGSHYFVCVRLHQFHFQSHRLLHNNKQSQSFLEFSLKVALIAPGVEHLIESHWITVNQSAMASFYLHHKWWLVRKTYAWPGKWLWLQSPFPYLASLRKTSTDRR